MRNQVISCGAFDLYVNFISCTILAPFQVFIDINYNLYSKDTFKKFGKSQNLFVCRSHRTTSSPRIVTAHKFGTENQSGSEHSRSTYVFDEKSLTKANNTISLRKSDCKRHKRRRKTRFTPSCHIFR